MEYFQEANYARNRARLPDCITSNGPYGWALDQLTRDNPIRQATSLHGERLPMMLPGISMSAKADDYAPFTTLRIAVFDGASWTLSGDPLSGVG